MGCNSSGIGRGSGHTPVATAAGHGDSGDPPPALHSATVKLMGKRNGHYQFSYAGRRPAVRRSTRNRRVAERNYAG